MEQSDTSKIDLQDIETKETKEGKEMLHELTEKPKDWAKTVKTIAVVAVIVGLGTATGYLLSNANPKGSIIPEGGIHKVIKTEKSVGSTDVKTFRDKAEGVLQRGGIDGEGTHKLIRPGGESQNVYLTSSVIDLEQFVGKKVRVWGETFTAQKAGWLMDVGKVELL